MSYESILKALILTNGVTFSDEALRFSSEVNAKQQNLVYNAPSTPDLMRRPQELLLTSSDRYSVCVSAVAPVPGCTPIHIDRGPDGFFVAVHPKIGSDFSSVDISCVYEPAFYKLQTQSGRPLTRIVSACGVDELNIWPWHDCAIEKPCSFCGINTIQGFAEAKSDLMYALRLRNVSDIAAVWSDLRTYVLPEIAEAVNLAINDQCYAHHVHVIISSGSLALFQLDDQARIYADIAAFLREKIPLFEKADGITAVTVPPRDLSLLQTMRDAGINTVVFNLEAFGAEAFEVNCPGKAVIGRTHFIEALERSVDVFGWSHAWSNFVLGLEDQRKLLAGCEWLASRGITPGANILHMDRGARAGLVPPDFSTAIWFFTQLASLYQRYNHRPFYCAKALRTSLANEAVNGRLDIAIIEPASSKAISRS
jgi:hypothetical protein